MDSAGECPGLSTPALIKFPMIDPLPSSSAPKNSRNLAGGKIPVQGDAGTTHDINRPWVNKERVCESARSRPA